MSRSMLGWSTARWALLAAVLLSGSACRLPTSAERGDATLCPQTSEFRNYGCALVVALVDRPPAPLPATFLLDVRAMPTGPTAGMISPGIATNPGFESVPLQLTLWSPLPAESGDTLSVWLVARLLDLSEPVATTVPPPTVAADSVLRVVRFAPVHARAPVDTVRLTPRQP